MSKKKETQAKTLTVTFKRRLSVGGVGEVHAGESKEMPYGYASELVSRGFAEIKDLGEAQEAPEAPKKKPRTRKKKA